MQVPRSASHFEIVRTFGNGYVHTAPAYRGSLWVDPESGTIFRISIVIDANDMDWFRRMELMVKYGPVQIGDRKFICPVNSLALQLSIIDVNLRLGDGPTEWLNVASYTNYHRFALHDSHPREARRKRNRANPKSAYGESRANRVSQAKRNGIRD